MDDPMFLASLDNHPLIKPSDTEMDALRAAATWLHDAVHFRTPSGDVHTPSRVYIYKVYHGAIFRFFRVCSTIALLVLPFFEEVRYCHWVEIISYFIVTLETLMRLYISQEWSRWVTMRLVSLPVSFIDTIFAMQGYPLISHARPLRIIRAVYILSSSQQMQMNSVALINCSLALVLKISLLLLAFLSTFTVIELVALKTEEELHSSYTKYVLGKLYTHFVTYTTVNFPNIALTHNDDKVAFIYWSVFMFVVTFYISNLILAEVFYTYRGFLKVESTRRWQNASKSAFLAFTTTIGNTGSLDMKDDHGSGLMSLPQFTALLRTAYPTMNTEWINWMFEELQTDEDPVLDATDFREILRLLRFETPLSQKNKANAWFSRIFDSGATSLIRVRLQYFVQSRLFDAFVNIVLLVAIISELFHSKSQFSGTSNEVFWRSAHIIIFLVILLEYSVQLLALGVPFMLKRTPLRFELFATTMFIFTSVLFGCSSPLSLAFRCVLALRILFISSQFTNLFTIIVQLSVAYNASIVCIYVFMMCYGFLGMSLFHGKLDPNNAALAGSDYAVQGFWPVNFDTFPRAMFLLFHLLIVNNWYITADAIRRTSGEFALAYFITYYIVVVMVLLAVSLSFSIQLFEVQRRFFSRHPERARTSGSRRFTSLLDPDNAPPGADRDMGLDEILEESLMEWKIMGELTAVHRKVVAYTSNLSP